MGCASSNPVSISNFKFINTDHSSIEMTQYFLVANLLIQEAHTLYEQLEGNHIILLRITKISITKNQSLLDAFAFWNRLVFLCNSNENCQQQLTFNFKDNKLNCNLGRTGELKLLWFPQVLNNYIGQVKNGNEQIPKILEQLKCLHTKIINIGERLKDKKYQSSSNLIKINLSFFKIVIEKIIHYQEEIESLFKSYESLVQEAKDDGLKLFKKYGTIKLQNGNYRIKTKIRNIIEQIYHGEMRSELSEEIQNKEKEARKKMKPLWTFGDDIGIGLKKFPFRIRWTGCESVDQCFLVISHYLENHSIHLLKIRKLISALKNLTRAYKTDQNTIIRAWEIFCSHLNVKNKETIQKSSNIKEGLMKIKLINSDAEKCRIYFIELLQQFEPNLLLKLQNEWQSYQETQERIISLWSNDQIFQDEYFQKLQSSDKYYQLTSMAKNVYALTNYVVVAKQVYTTNYQKQLEKGKLLMQQLNTIYLTQKYCDNQFCELNQIFEKENDQKKIKQREAKLQYLYEKFLKSP